VAGLAQDNPPRDVQVAPENENSHDFFINSRYDIFGLMSVTNLRAYGNWLTSEANAAFSIGRSHKNMNNNKGLI
jgi:hypothetical protein